MAVDFGIDVQIISDEGLQAEIDKISKCLKNSGIELNLDSSSPGLGALITTLIRSMEKALISSYEPLIALVNVVVESLKAGVAAVTVFIEKVANLLNGIIELLSGLPMSIIDFIVNKVLDPIIKNINIPFFSASALIEIIMGFLTGSLTVNELIKDIKENSDEWIKLGKIVIPQKIIDKGQKAIENAKKFIIECTEAFMKLLEFLIFPINFAIKLVEKVLTFVKDLASDLIKTIKSLLEIISNPVQWVLDFIGDIIGDIVAYLASLFANITEDIENFKEWIKKLFSKIFKIGVLSFDIDNWLNEEVPEPYKTMLEQVIGFIKVIKCFLLWLVSLISPETIINLLFGGASSSIKMPPLKISSYDADTRTIYIDKDSAKPIDVFVVGDNINFEHSECGVINATVSYLTDTTIVISSDPTYNPNSGGANDNIGGGKAEKVN